MYTLFMQNNIIKYLCIRYLCQIQGTNFVNKSFM